MRQIIKILIFILFLSSTKLFAEDETINNFYWKIYNSNHKENIGSRIVGIAKGFLGQKYVGGVLDENENESCVINPFELDCVTMIEQSLALARLGNNVTKENILDELTQELTFIRYRNGELKDYLSRLHYSKDWALDNIKKGILKDVGKEIGENVAEVYKKEINFMSSHPQYYNQLKSNPELIIELENIENQINSGEIYFIPKEKITQNILKKIKSGDLIFFTTNISGLDYSHTAIAYRDDDENKNKLGLIHASTTHKKVVIENNLLDYINSVEKHSGITVLRAL